MSNDVRGLLQGAAMVPTLEANVSAAWKRGRRLRAQRLVAGGMAIVVVIALGSAAVAKMVDNGDGTKPVVPATTARACDLSSASAALPAWTDSANAPTDVPHLVSPDGNVAAVLFGEPLVAGVPTTRQNKILWIVRQPRGGKPLEITATLVGHDANPVHVEVPAGSSPGEIYPSTVNVPLPGCWQAVVTWNGHRSTVDLPYGERTPSKPAVTTSTTTPPTIPTIATGTCRTANLAITVGQPSGAAGHEYYDVTFRNNGTTSCTLTGFPGVSFFDAANKQVGRPAARNPVSYSTIELAPGAAGLATLGVLNPDMPNCPAATANRIRLYPPNETTSALVPIGPIRMCDDQVPSHANTINPVVGLVGGAR